MLTDLEKEVEKLKNSQSIQGNRDNSWSFLIERNQDILNKAIKQYQINEKDLFSALLIDMKYGEAYREIYGNLAYDKMVQTLGAIINSAVDANKTKNKNNTVFSRLYEDGKERINSRTKKEQNIMNKILEMANVINPTKNFDITTINRLYENKEKKYNIKKIIKKVEEEEGTTFKPFLSQNNYSRTVNGTFYERNQKLINDRESFCEEENKKIEENEKKHIIGKEYTKEERQKVINNIINRLYHDSSFIKKSIKDSNDKDKK